MSTRDQIQRLQSVNQAAAGWLLGIDARRLRERSDIPRAGDGTYNARELLAWAKRNPSPRDLAALVESLEPEALCRLADLVMGRIEAVLPTLPSRP